MQSGVGRAAHSVHRGTHCGIVGGAYDWSACIVGGLSLRVDRSDLIKVSSLGLGCVCVCVLGADLTSSRMQSL